MTEAEWLRSQDPHAMLAWLRDNDRLTERKARLFCVAVCRRIWPLLADERLRLAVEVAEAYSDGSATADELRAAEETAASGIGPGDYAGRAALCCTIREDGDAYDFADVPGYAMSQAIRMAIDAVAYPSPGFAEAVLVRSAESAAHAALLRDLFGDPSEPPLSLDTALLAWRGGLIPQLVKAAHDDRKLPEGTLDPARLAVLCDALEEAGADAGRVEHLRGTEPHYRGCHAIDAILGRQYPPAGRASALTPGVLMDLISQHVEVIQALFDAAEEAGMPLWLENGWAIDARLGVVSREHGDIDVAYPKDQEERYLGLLRSLGYGPHDYTDYGFLCSRGDILLDSEPCHRTGDGYGFAGFPPGSCPLAKEGVLRGYPVRCVSWGAMYFECLGYLRDIPLAAWRDKDHQSLRVIEAHLSEASKRALREHFGRG